MVRTQVGANWGLSVHAETCHSPAVDERRRAWVAASAWNSGRAPQRPGPAHRAAPGSRADRCRRQPPLLSRSSGAAAVGPARLTPARESSLVFPLYPPKPQSLSPRARRASDETRSSGSTGRGRAPRRLVGLQPRVRGGGGAPPGSEPGEAATEVHVAAGVLWFVSGALAVRARTISRRCPLGAARRGALLGQLSGLAPLEVRVSAVNVPESIRTRASYAT